jgi:hypothetical protein
VVAGAGRPTSSAPAASSEPSLGTEPSPSSS